MIFAQLSALATSPVLADVDLIKLLSASKGITLVVVIILLTLVALCIFVILYKLIQVSQAQSQSRS